MEKDRRDFYRARLVREFNRICSTIERKREESRTEISTSEADLLDRSVQSFSKEHLCLLCEMDQRRLALVREALDRIESNAYGLCEECQGPIGDRRLQALPWSNLCIQCQGARESAMAS